MNMTKPLLQDATGGSRQESPPDTRRVSRRAALRETRQEASLDLPLDPPRAGESKQTWVYRQIRERILKGCLLYTSDAADE